MSFDKTHPVALTVTLLMSLGLASAPGCGGQSPPVTGTNAGEQNPDEAQGGDTLRHLEQPPPDPRAALEAALVDGTLRHDGDDNQFLEDVLRITGVPTASQVLVFSKTSMQSPLITPSHPRAIYFSDDFYIGFVPGGLIEISDTDPEDGTGFYALEPRSYDLANPLTAPVQCLNCHISSRTHYAPGLLVRSVYPDDEGFPIAGAGSFTTGHASPLQERWGGWYVTGRHGAMRHMGNAFAKQVGSDAQLDTGPGANVTELDSYIDPSRYLHPGSDIVALMVLEHQVEMHNVLTQSSLAVRRQEWRSRRVAESSGGTFDPYASETLMSLVEHDAQRIVEHMLFVDEVQLTDPVRGDRAFIRQFRANRRESANGRSLKDTDLNSRLFKYRCSYMVYARAFELMPDLLTESVYRQLFDALTGPESEMNSHLPQPERAAIVEILRETVDELPGYWRE